MVNLRLGRQVPSTDAVIYAQAFALAVACKSIRPFAVTASYPRVSPAFAFGRRATPALICLILCVMALRQCARGLCRALQENQHSIASARAVSLENLLEQVISSAVPLWGCL